MLKYIIIEYFIIIECYVKKHLKLLSSNIFVSQSCNFIFNFFIYIITDRLYFVSLGHFNCKVISDEIILTLPVYT